MRRGWLAGVVFVVSMMAGPSWAQAATTICVPEAASKPILSTNTKGECPPKGSKPTIYKSVTLPDPAMLAHMNYMASGVGGKPTIQFSGVNVQIVNGEGSTGTTNGAGNLVIGYDANSGGHEQTGSHNLVLGKEQTFTSFGGIVAGAFNTISGEFASVTGGEENSATAFMSSVSGGAENGASGAWSSISGGVANVTTAPSSSVSGGILNKNLGHNSWIGGGRQNEVASEVGFASVFGGNGLIAKADYEAIP
jgi:hypothetical protein